MNLFRPKASPTAEAAMSDASDEDRSVVSQVDEEEAQEKKENWADGSASVSSSSEQTSTRGSTTKEEPMTKKETAAVNRSKLLVYIALLLAAAAVGTLTWHFTSQEEQNDFERDIAGFADEIVDVAEANARKIFGQMHGLSTTMTSFAERSNMTWPNVTLPHFDIRAKEAEDLTGMELIVFSPIVTVSNKAGWEDYAWKHQDWISEDLKYHEGGEDLHPGNITREIFTYNQYKSALGLDDGDRMLTVYDEEYYVPLWQMGPVPTNASIINIDLYSNPSFHRMVNDVLEIEHKLLSEVADLDFLFNHSDVHINDDQPRSYVLQPVWDRFEEGARVVGFFAGEMAWESFFINVLPEGTADVLVDVKGSCGNEFSYIVRGHHADYIGRGDLHESKYDNLKFEFEFAEFARYDGFTEGVHCEYKMKIYPTGQLEAQYHTNKPAVYTTVVVLVFMFTVAVFAFYDYMVYRRQTRLLAKAKRTNAIVASLFPKDVQKRIMAEAEQQAEAEQRAKKGGFLVPKAQLKEYLDEDQGNDIRQGDAMFKTKPIADLFPQCTIMFADIVGFTAWSSMREPAQVFTLLETIFHEFDYIAKRRRVFKVETVGDCYVAVAGLPDPRKDHAIVMARFARDCLYKFSSVIHKLELALGPDTSELGMRFGLHSGPVTAGVLRGEKARFQLFGDTMNTTARIETTGAKNKIHVSQETADLIMAAGKSHWVRPREEKVFAKGKGELKTYWIELKGDSARSSRSGSSEESDSNMELESAQATLKHLDKPVTSEGLKEEGEGQNPLNVKTMRLVQWNTEVLARFLREVVARREASGISNDSSETIAQHEQDVLKDSSIVLDEVKDVVWIPKFDSDAASKQKSANEVELGDGVVEQLQSYIQTIAAMYRDNPFHNFEHASHVTMSVVKLLSRIVAPDLKCTKAQDLHDHTYGITSDPLTQFSVILSALIHDVDHTGVPNFVLVKEQASIASVYKNKSVAEQNSVDIAWELLMQDCYAELRSTIYATVDEFKRFRQFIVNSVMATDIMDKELSGARKSRWNVAFAESADASTTDDEMTNRKATIVIEHLIQASDVAHTMQHWHIYRKWNARLFEEMYKAYAEGRTDKDPSENWYEGEIGFFDFYIIPLAMKLRSCGVFGVSSDEYLNYAQQNRRQWEAQGRAIVEEVKASISYHVQEKVDNATETQTLSSNLPEKKSENASQA